MFRGYHKGYPNQNTPGVNKVATKYLNKAMLKKMKNQNEWPRPPAVVGIKVFNSDLQAAKHHCCLTTS